MEVEKEKENNEILVSVLVAVYNMRDTIDRCIQSLLNQTLKNIEIIIVDDGSTDSSGDICDQYAQKDNRLKVIHQKNMGLSLSREVGVKNASGKYISFVDSDDWCELDMCEKLYEKAEKSSADLVFCSAYRHRQDGVAIICNLPVPEGLYSIKDLYDCYILPLYGDLKKDQLVTTGYVWCCLFKSELVKHIKFFKEICLHEDEIIILQAFMNAKTLYITDQPFYHYNRMSYNTLSKRADYWNGYWDNIVEVFKAKKEFAFTLFQQEDAYMGRLVTYLYMKFLRSIRNETHYTNPAGFLGGLIGVYQLKDKKILHGYKKYLLKEEFSFTEQILIKLIHLRLYFIVYFYYAIKCNRMRTFQEKTKN